MKEKIDLCTNMLKGANIEGEDEREDTIQDMEGLFMFLSKLKLKQNSRTWLVITCPIWALIGLCMRHACNWTV